MSGVLNKWWVLLAMTISSSMIYINMTVLPVALPTISRALNASNLAVEWILNAYMLALTVFVLPGGRLADRIGLKNGFCLGLSIFVIASIFCGLSESILWLIVNRGLQGLGGALLLPSIQGIVASVFPAGERGKGMGVYASIGSIFLASGPLIGGAVTQYFSWRYLFWINLPIGVVGLIFAFLLIPVFPSRKMSVDLLGFLALGGATSAIIIAIMNAQIWGWSSPYVLLLAAIGIGLFFLLYKIQSLSEHPILDFSILRQRGVLTSSVVIICAQIMVMVTIFWTIYFQNAMLYSASEAGLIVFIANAPILFFAPIAGVLGDKLGPRIPVALGFCLTTFAFMSFFFIKGNDPFISLLPALLAFGIGTTLIYTPNFAHIMHDIPDHKRGIVAGINIFICEWGATLGLAIFGSLFHSFYRYKFVEELQERPLSATLNPVEYQGLLAQVPDAVSAWKELPREIQGYVHDSLFNAYVFGFDWINLVAAGCSVIGLGVAIKFLNSTRSTGGVR